MARPLPIVHYGFNRSGRFFGGATQQYQWRKDKDGVSIAVGDSLGALPQTRKSIRTNTQFQSQWAILWGRYPGNAHCGRAYGHVSIAVGDSLGALRICEISTGTSYDVSIAVGDSLGALPKKRGARLMASKSFNRSGRFFGGATTPQALGSVPAVKVSIAVGDSLGALPKPG